MTHQKYSEKNYKKNQIVRTADIWRERTVWAFKRSFLATSRKKAENQFYYRQIAEAIVIVALQSFFYAISCDFEKGVKKDKNAIFRQILKVEE